MEYNDSTISAFIKSHESEPLALSAFAVDAVLHAKNLKTLYSMKTTHVLYDAFVTGLDAYYTELPEDKLDDFREASYLLTLGKHYDWGFQEKIYDSFCNTLIPSCFDGDYAQAPLTRKMAHLNVQARKFLHDFDPDNLLDMKRQDGDQLIKLNNVWLTQKTKDTDSEKALAYYNRRDQTMYIQRYAGYYTAQGRADIKFTMKHSSEYPLSAKRFNFDRSHDDYHIQHNNYLKKGRTLKFFCAMKDEDDSIGRLAHEITHLVADRVDALYNASPDKAKEHFAFDAKDHDMKKISNMTYAVNGKYYWLNLEEMFAHRAQAWVKEKFNPLGTKHKAA